MRTVYAQVNKNFKIFVIINAVVSFNEKGEVGYDGYLLWCCNEKTANQMFTAPEIKSFFAMNLACIYDVYNIHTEYVA
jgi:hypothetical protein